MAQTTSPALMAQALYAAGFRGEAIPTMIAIAKGESGWDTNAVCDSCLGVAEYSVGLFQINLQAHTSVTEACAKDVFCASKEAYRISNNGTNFNPWTQFTNGGYRKYLAEVVAVIGNSFEDLKGLVDTLTDEQIKEIVKTAPFDVVNSIFGILPPFMRGLVSAFGGDIGAAMVSIVPMDLLRTAVRSLDDAALVTAFGGLGIFGGVIGMGQDAIDAVMSIDDLIGWLGDSENIKNAAIVVALLTAGLMFIGLGARGIIGNSETFKSAKQMVGLVATKGASGMAAKGASAMAAKS